jgi:hypothetical protein
LLAMRGCEPESSSLRWSRGLEWWLRAIAPFPIHTHPKVGGGRQDSRKILARAEAGRSLPIDGHALKRAFR